jgi:hypothetical protein
MADGRDLTAELFGGGGRTSVDTWRSQLALDQLEEQHGLPPGLMTSVLRQESGGDPRVTSSAGAQGLFQFMPATAAQYKIDPFDPQQAAPAAARELRALYTKYGGDVDRTLAAWNWGQGNVDRQGMANMPQETRGFLVGVKRFLSPGVAEAATPTSGRDLSQELFGTRAPAQPPEGAAAAGASTEEPITPEARVLRLPAIQALPLEERTERFKEFYGLRPAFKEEFLRGEEPPSDLTVAKEKPSPTLPRTPFERQARIREELAAWEQQQGRPWRDGDPLMPSQKAGMVPSQGEAPLEEGITRPRAMIPLLMGGAGAKAVGSVLGGQMLPKVAGRVLRPVAEGLSQTLGWTTGRTAETGQVPSPGEIGTEAALTTLTGGAIEGLGAARQAAIRRSQAGRAVRQEGQAVVPEAYQQAVEGQRQAIASARSVPGRYSPETPSWTLYERFGDAAKNQEVDLLTAKTALADVRAGRGVLPDGSLRPFPQAVERIATSLEQAEGPASVQTIREELRRLGPLTRHADGNIRGPAKQLYGIYGDAMEASPVANDLLRQANTTFRREMALQDVQEWLRPGHGVIRIDNQGREVLNTGALLTKLEKTIGDDTLFARSFGPDDLQALKQDFGRLAGTPSMPRGAPPAPQTAREAIGERPRFLPTGRGLGSLGGVEFLATSLGVPLGVAAAVKAASAAAKQARYGLAYALTSERLRPLVVRAIRGDGTLDPRVYGWITLAMTPAEKKALERETREKRR